MCFVRTHRDGHSEGGQESPLSKNAMAWGTTSVLSASMSRGISLSYTYNRHKGPPLWGGQEFLWVTQGQAVVWTAPAHPPLLHSPCMSPSHRNKMCGQRAQTHSLYPPDDYTSFKSNNLNSLCFYWCRSSLEFIQLQFLWGIFPFSGSPFFSLSTILPSFPLAPQFFPSSLPPYREFTWFPHS